MEFILIVVHTVKDGAIARLLDEPPAKNILVQKTKIPGYKITEPTTQKGRGWPYYTNRT